MSQQLSKRMVGRCRFLGLALGWMVCFPVAPAIASELQSQTSANSISDQRQSDPQVKAVIDRMAAAGVLHPSTVEEVRRAYLFYPTLSGKPERVFRVEDRRIPGPAGQISIRVYTPNPSTQLPVFVFFHGGGFVTGNLDVADTPLRSVANRCGCIVVSVDYRLAPENPYPAAPDDAFAATKWVAEHAPELGGDAGRIAVGGDGAGGNLAAVVALMARDRSGPHLIYQVLIYPDITAIMLGSRYLSNDPIVTPDARIATLGAYVPLVGNQEDPYISPIYAKSLAGLPPALLITDQDDPAWDEGGAYAKRLRQAHVSVTLSVYPNMIHGFFLMAGALDAGKKCIDEVAAALTEAFKNGSTSSSVTPTPH
jgi:acetyl esterase